MIGSFKDFITERSTNERVVVSNKEASDLAKSKSGGKKKDAVVPGSSQSLKNHDRQQKADEERAKIVADIEDVDTDDDEE